MPSVVNSEILTAKTLLHIKHGIIFVSSFEKPAPLKWLITTVILVSKAVVLIKFQNKFYIADSGGHIIVHISGLMLFESQFQWMCSCAWSLICPAILSKYCGELIYTLQQWCGYLPLHWERTTQASGVLHLRGNGVRLLLLPWQPRLIQVLSLHRPENQSLECRSPHLVRVIVDLKG